MVQNQEDDLTLQTPNIDRNVVFGETTDDSVKQDRNMVRGSNNTIGYSVCRVLMCSVLLLCPLIMGITISSIGNDEYIKRHFIRMHFVKNVSLHPYVTGDMFPARMWSLGFLYPFGGWFGSLIGALTVDKFGRKKPTILFCIVAIAGAGMKIVSRYFHLSLLFAGRFMDGVAASGLMVSGILLMFDTLPESLETIYKPLIQIFVNAGIMLIGGCSLYSVVQDNWNMVHFLTLGLSTFLVLVVFFIPESPKFMYNKTRNLLKTEKILRKLRGTNYDPRELESIRNQAVQNQNIKQMSIGEFIKDRRFRFAILSLIVLHVGQQLSGINSITAFAPILLKSSGFQDPDLCSLLVIFVGLVGSVIFAPIVRNQKRRVLWLTGFIFMLASFVGFLIIQPYNIYPLIKLSFLGIFVFMFQIGPGPVCWFISIEMFPSNAIGAAQGIASFFNWFANTLVFWLFPILEDALKYKALIVFIVFQTLVIIYSYFFVVETLNRTSTEVLADYEKKQCC